jgi:DNA repair exonuclease SbcCD nuclease subunit
LHTSDVQLDAPLAFLGKDGQKLRAQFRETFGKIIDLASSSAYDMLLIAGDLFDSNRPSQQTLDFILARLAKAAVPVCILPGNHDCYEPGSVYRKVEFPANVTVLTDALAEQVFPELNLTIYGTAVLRRDTHDPPLADLRPSSETRWHVAMAHGNVVGGLVENPYRPIRSEEIAASGMDYVALGDWHAYSKQSAGGVEAAYSGSPEPTSFADEGAGYVVGVEIGDSGVNVSQVRVGEVSARSVRIEVTGKSGADLTDEIHRLADPNLILDVILAGLQSVGDVIQTEELESSLAAGFYHLRCRDESHPWLEDITEDEFPPQVAVGKFIELMRREIDGAETEADRQRAEQALQVGVALLQGKEVLS